MCLENVGVDIKLDLDTRKAEEKLRSFKESAKSEDIKFNLDVNNLSDVERKIKNINRLLDSSKNTKVNTSGSDKSVNEYLRVGKQLDKLYSDLHKSQTNGTDQISNSIKKEIDLYRNKQLALASTIRSNNLLTESTKKMIAQEEALSRARNNTRNVTTDTNNTRSQEADVNRLTASYEKYKQKLDDIQNKLNGMQNSRGFLDNDLVERTNNLLEQTRHSLDANGIQSDFNQVGNTVRELVGHLNNINMGNTLSRQEANFNTSLESMRNRVERFADSFRDVNGADRIVDGLRRSLSNINTENIERATVDLRQFGNELNRAQREAGNLGRSTTGRTGFFSNFGEEFRSNMMSFTAGELLADGIRSVAHEVVSVVMEYDKAMTNLKKVSSPEQLNSVGGLGAIGDQATKISRSVGKSSSEVIQSISDTVQTSGKGMKESILIAEQAMKLANVAEMTQENATKGVTTMVSAFKLDSLKQMPVVVNGVTKSTTQLNDALDKVNYVGNNFAISSEGIITSIQSGANVLASTGVSLTDTIALVTGANTTLQNPEKVGNGLIDLAC